jgi:hypothetical protein
MRSGQPPVSSEDNDSLDRLSLTSHQVLYGIEYDDNISIHPIKRVLASCSWNNIPLPVKDLFELISEYVVSNQKEFMERKAISNERMFKLQTMISQLHARVKKAEAFMKEV